MHGRRAFVIGAAALAAFPVASKKPAPAPKTANIRWPGPGHDLHGYMAIPAKAHGPQPAVLVVHDRNGGDAFTRAFADHLALAGFVACAPTLLASLDDGVATVRWLATNAYATGRVGAVGLGWGGALVDRIAASPGALLACGVTFGSSADARADAPPPILRLAMLDATVDAPARDALWAQAVNFLDAQLRR